MPFKRPSLTMTSLVLLAAAIVHVQEKKPLSEDTSIGKVLDRGINILLVW